MNSQQRLEVKDSYFRAETLELIKKSTKQKLLEYQGQCKIQEVTSLKRIPIILDAIIFLLFGAATLLLGWAFLLRNIRLRAGLFYYKTEQQNATHFLIKGDDGSYVIEAASKVYEEVCFTYRKVKYHKHNEYFVPIYYDYLVQKQLFNPLYYNQGYNANEVESKKAIYALNTHFIKAPNFFIYVLEQMTKIFFIIQYLLSVLNIYQKNYDYAIALLLFYYITCFLNFYLLRESYLKIQKISNNNTKVEVFREKKKIEIDSTDLVPGDIFIPRDVIPCDCILVSGQIFVNQVNITGENISIQKFIAEKQIKITEKKNWVLEGSNIISTNQETKLLVVNTGFLSKTGRLLRKHIVKQNVSPQFFLNGTLYLFMMCVIGFIIYGATVPYMKSHYYATMMVFFRGISILGWTIPPPYPIFFNLINTFSILRLRKANIQLLHPHKAVKTGKIKTVCFDKTGTLTENSMLLISFFDFSEKQTQSFIKDIPDLNQNTISAKLFACCNSVFQADNKYNGQELDLRTFLFSGFTLQYSNQGNRKFVKKNKTKLEILRINPFESKFKTSSVLVKDIAEENFNKYYIFAKGSHEKIMNSTCKLVNSNIKNIDDPIFQVESRGLRSVCYGYKQINESQLQVYLHANRLDFQKNLTVLGLINFEYKLFQQTKYTIKTLKDADIQPVVITGDHIYISIQTCFRCGIFEQNTKKVIAFTANMQTKLDDEILVGEVLIYTQNTIKRQVHQFSFQEYLKIQDYIAIDFKFFLLVQTKKLDIIHKIKIFSRVPPEGKANIVKGFKQHYINLQNDIFEIFKKKLKVAMCGDGANDIGAIKEADIGIGLSNSDSTLMASFSIPSIDGVITIITEGKASLINVIEIFRYYGTIHFLKLTISIILLLDNSYFSVSQLLYYNYASTLLISLFLGFSSPCKKLSKQLPNDITFSVANMLIYNGHILIPTGGLILVYWYTTQLQFFEYTIQSSYNSFLTSTYASTMVFLSTQLLIISNVFWIYISKPFKKPLYKNIPMVIIILADFIVGIILFFVTDKNILNLKFIPYRHAGQVLGITIGVMILGYLYEKFLTVFQIEYKYEDET